MFTTLSLESQFIDSRYSCKYVYFVIGSAAEEISIDFTFFAPRLTMQTLGKSFLKDIHFYSTGSTTRQVQKEKPLNGF